MAILVATGSTRVSTPQSETCPGLDARNGLSLARNGRFFQSCHSEVNAPDLLLRVLACCLRRPFGPPLSNRHRLAPVNGYVKASGPLLLPQ